MIETLGVDYLPGLGPSPMHKLPGDTLQSYALMSLRANSHLLCLFMVLFRFFHFMIEIEWAQFTIALFEKFLSVITFFNLVFVLLCYFM